MCLSIIRIISKFLLLLLIFSCCYGDINIDDVNKVANKIQKVLSTLLKNVTQYKQLQEKLQKLNDEKILILKEIDVEKTTSSFKQNIQNVFSEYIEALKNIKTKAEDLSKTYKHDPDISIFQYYSQHYIDKTKLAPNAHFNNMAVNFTHSTIRLPGNIYNYSVDILNGIKWTDGLDETFIENSKKTPTLLWQYFGTDEAIYRDYPAHAFSG